MCRKSPFTKAELMSMVIKQNTKPAKRFIHLMSIVSRYPGRLDAWRELVEMCSCDNHTAKTEGLTSIDTSSKITCADNAMIDDPSMICAHCFSNEQQDRQPNTFDKLVRNTLLFAFYDIPAEAFPIVNRLFFRFECFGDLMTAIQFRNYCKMARRNPRVQFVEWTKKPWIMAQVLRNEPKPSNLIIILSAPRLNDPMTIEQARAAWPFVDKLFTVYDAEYIDAHDVVITCGGRHCMSCLHCYELGNGYDHVKEQKK